MKYKLLDDSLIDEIANDPAQERWLILDEHPAYRGYWKVQSLDNTFFFDFKDIVGAHKVVSPADLAEFLDTAEALEYEVVFGDDPLGILDSFEHLNDAPEISIRSTLEGTVNGLLPYQVQGYNKLKDLDFGWLLWSTGTGKTAESIALTKHHLKHENFKTCFVFVTSNNRINTSRWYERLGELGSYVIDGIPKKREVLYGQILDDLAAGRPSISILNYEKVRDDFCSYRKSEDGKQWLVDMNPLAEQIFVDNDLLIFWDEASTKMKNRTSKLYKGITKCLYAVAPPSVNWEKKRPNKLTQYAMTATPVEVDPEDHFNVHRVMDGGQTLGTVKDFHERYAASFDFFDSTRVAKWRDLDDIALRTAFCTHMVDKTHPDIASQFPSTLHEQVYIDWDEQDRKTYDKLTKELVKKVEEVDDEGNSAVSMFAALGIAQMLCDAPTMVNDSAALREAYNQLLEDQDIAGDPEGSETALKLLESLGNIKLTNDRHTKILKLKEIITERHPEEKVLIYTVFNKTLLPLMGEWLDDWGITYVTYTGSPRKKQDAEDAFREDPNIRAFLSSDAGSNSINLEMAKVGINYDLPWNYSTKTQREGRNSRRTSTFDTLYWYDLLMANSVEDRRQALNERKKGYHDVITGRANAESISARMTRDELLSILKG